MMVRGASRPLTDSVLPAVSEGVLSGLLLGLTLLAGCCHPTAIFAGGPRYRRYAGPFYRFRVHNACPGPIDVVSDPGKRAAREGNHAKILADANNVYALRAGARDGCDAVIGGPHLSLWLRPNPEAAFHPLVVILRENDRNLVEVTCTADGDVSVVTTSSPYDGNDCG